MDNVDNALIDMDLCIFWAYEKNIPKLICIWAIFTHFIFLILYENKNKMLVS